jgi:hypothetical protein
MAENDSKEKAGRITDRNERSLRLEARRAVPAKVRVVPVVPTAPGGVAGVASQWLRSVAASF